MNRFQTCLGIVLGHEGGYSDHPKDRGGATNYGVIQKVYSEYLASLGLPDKKVQDIKPSEVEAIYSQYWRDSKASYMPEPLDLLMFDTAVNSGPSRAIKLLQRTLGVTEDGSCGKETLGAVHEEVVATSIDHLCRSFLDEREYFVNEIVNRRPDQVVFLDGWVNRINHLREFV